jgi:hypothetical protein
MRGAAGRRGGMARTPVGVQQTCGRPCIPLPRALPWQDVRRMQGALWATRLPGATFGCAYLPAARHCLVVCGDAGRVHLLDAGAAAGPGATRPLPWPEAAVLWLWDPEVDARAEGMQRSSGMAMQT